MAPSRVDYAIPNADTMKAANIGLVDLTREDRDYSRALYDAQILYVDQKLKDFFAEIEKKRLLENSLVIVLSDHGEAFGEHKFWGHGWTLYEEMTHIPLLLRFPGEEYAGRVIEERVSLVDIAPTVADYLELPLAEQWHGEFLLPLLQDTDSKVERRIYSQLWNNHAMYQGFLKLIEQKDPTPSRHNRDHMPAEAVFDLGKDPKERENLIDNPPMAATEEFTRLHQALSVMATQRNAEGSVEEVQLDSEQVEELQALGYLK